MHNAIVPCTSFTEGRFFISDPIATKQLTGIFQREPLSDTAHIHSVSRPLSENTTFEIGVDEHHISTTSDPMSP